MQNLYIEESREFLGLMICLLVLAVCWWRDALVKAKVQRTHET
jgi:hypothetical protein